MTIHETIRKNNLEIAELKFIVQEYIKIRKGVEVSIDLSNRNQELFQLQLLILAFNEACGWLLKNGY